MNNGIEHLKSIKTFSSLVKYLRDELDWPVESDDFEDLTYDYEADELGIDAKTAAKIKEIKQLRPLVSNQPWGIFFINFEPKRLPIVALRRILRSLVIKKRASANKSQQAAWRLHDLLFVSSYGEAGERQITFAHFSEGSATGDLPTLNVLGWSAQNTMLRLEDTHRTLKEKLRWPSDETDIESWRKEWSSAFTLTYRYSIRTSKELSIELARLATVIRARVNEVLAVESERGQVRQLYKAFQEALIHDLSEDDFADMYAQTIAYGLLSARVSRESGALVAENVADMVPVTNPFLKELMQTFLTVGGRKNRIDFDELGINEVVELLRQANMESVLKDFGDRNPNEDPVIHFYELFLKQYDPQKRLKRGVFYTPKPVVSFIVRSVDEILRTEFGLEDGLADTITWGEMKQRIEAKSVPPAVAGGSTAPRFEIPKGVKPDTPFVQILDPATGTGTFLVEVIDVIYRTMVEKWQREGRNEREVRELWNEYVPRHLLTRLHGFELMMAPYAIAHMKIGLKLKETKYAFLSSERARIYLTNTLEEPKDFSDYFEQMAPALAHEANAANKIKRSAPITVVIGNPPYSVNSLNNNSFIDGLMGLYKESVRGEQGLVALSDDYLKFMRYAQQVLSLSRMKVFGFITNRGFLKGIIHRGVRQTLLADFDQVLICDLHGDTNIGEHPPDGMKNENVFDIQQGVAISIYSNSGKLPANPRVSFLELWGTRPEKTETLLQPKNSLKRQVIEVIPPNFFFVPFDSANQNEYDSYCQLNELLRVNSCGVKTHRDALITDFDRACLSERIRDIASSHDLVLIRKRYSIKDTPHWSLANAKKFIDAVNVDSLLYPLTYRPFDSRWIYYNTQIIEKGDSKFPTLRHLLHHNISLLTSRIQAAYTFNAVFVSRSLVEMKTAESTRSSTVFPLYLYQQNNRSQHSFDSGDNRYPNLSRQFIADFVQRLKLEFIPDGRGDLSKIFGPEDIFH